ncbi:MAG: LptF/LptG family permease [Simkaniaceae bacterium]|nr:LptF/LptG family permease [Simkaniaceae bacterium]
MKIYQRYIFKEVATIFFSCLLMFYLLYALLDFSLHMGFMLYHEGLKIYQIMLYYLLQFIKRLDLLLPLSLVIATIRTLFSLNVNHELVAFRSSGVKLRELCAPMIYISLFCALLGYVNFELTLPSARKYIDHFETTYLSHIKESQKSSNELKSLFLQDGSRLIYQNEGEKLHDVFWIHSIDDLWHMKYLDVSKEMPTGRFVDHLVRNREGTMEKIASHDFLVFDNMPFHSRIKPSKVIPHENRSISQLIKLLILRRYQSLDEKSEIQTQCFSKLTMPWLALITVLFAIPFCTRFSRAPKIFITYTIALFSYISIFTIMDGCIILGSHHLVHPALAVFGPMLLLLSISGVRFLQRT